MRVAMGLIGLAINGVGLDRARGVSDQRLGEGDGQWGLLAHRFYVSAGTTTDKTIFDGPRMLGVECGLAGTNSRVEDGV
jgi:hypothetical protein